MGLKEDLLCCGDGAGDEPHGDASAGLSPSCMEDE